ncbi:DeoR family transcriptional regulator [Nocardioides sp. NPDC047086]|uniref:DeoR/GlpR family DNA-binding transcription regulator n=1 Tax=Nocardioides sp. NPDC047086 TaxID=3154810 RepID=UPI0034010559
MPTLRGQLDVSDHDVRVASQVASGMVETGAAAMVGDLDAGARVDFGCRHGGSQRVYGGALPVSPALADYTALAVAQALPADLECTVITNSPTVASALLQHPRADLFLLGGRVFKHSAVTCGAAAVEAAQNVSADLCLIGVTGVHPEAGLTTGDAEDAAMKRALAARAAETYVLASSEKIGTASPYRVLPWGQITGIITDADPSDEVIKQLSALDVEILHAGAVL